MSPVSPGAVGALVGLLAGAGLWCVLWWASSRRPRLDDRLAPYLRSRAGGSGLLDRPARSPFPTLERLMAPVMAEALAVVERLGSPTADLRRRLARAGSDRTVEELRTEQVVWAALGAAGGLVLALLVVARGGHPVSAVVVVLTGALTGFVTRDQLLSREVRRREQRMMAELPTVAELLALAVAAGEGPLAALERVARTTRGELPTELERALGDIRAGTPLTVALDRVAERTGLVALARLTEAVAVAVERGTPLADVLRAQAGDVREAGRTALMEEGGRKEVLMMIPVVFLILPVTVAFAVFPGLAALRLEL